FDDPKSGWATWEGNGNKIAYDQGVLHFVLFAPQYDFWSMSGKQFSDARIEVDVMVAGGPVNNAFGVICRYQDKDNFYGFIVSADGYYGIIKMKDGNRVVLTNNGSMEYRPELKIGLGAYHLQAVCSGINLSLSVDGVQLAEVVDPDFVKGDTGLMAGSYDLPGVDLLFDNFSVYQP
ncbi:MAG: hypothetical protein HGA53_09385, partial [Anaerolineaceae bacterium]|nr:hypothetical protein [Anaerolineaceae bacterium]